ncbi:MAG: hypothetical protein ABL974_22665, partial [Prosthecobacter sp.]
MKTLLRFSCLLLLTLWLPELRAEEPVGIPMSELVSRITVKEKPAILAYGEVRPDGKVRALSAEETLTAQFDTTVFFLVSHLDGWLSDVSSPSDAYTKAWRLVTDTTDKSGTDQLAEVKLVLAQAINTRDTTAKLRLEKTADTLPVQALDLEMKRQDLMVKAAEKALDDLKIQLGLPVTERIVLDYKDMKDLQVIDPNGTLDDAVTTALTARLDLWNTRDQVEDTSRRVLVAKQQVLPTVNAV